MTGLLSKRMMMINSVRHARWLNILVGSFLVCTTLSGQVTDFQTAWEARLAKGFKSGRNLGLSIEQRFRENSNLYDRTMATLEGSYKLAKEFDIDAGARWIIMKNSCLQLENRFRLHADLNYKTALKPVSVSLRTMVQYGFDEQVLRKEPNLLKLYDRNRIELGYHFFGTKWSVLAGYELYTQLFNREGVAFCRSKTTAGVSYDINHRSSLNLTWLYDREFNQANPQHAHMPTLSYSYKL